MSFLWPNSICLYRAPLSIPITVFLHSFSTLMRFVMMDLNQSTRLNLKVAFTEQFGFKWSTLEMYNSYFSQSKAFSSILERQPRILWEHFNLRKRFHSPLRQLTNSNMSNFENRFVPTNHGTVYWEAMVQYGHRLEWWVIKIHFSFE